MKPRRVAISSRCSSFTAIPRLSHRRPCVQHCALLSVRLPLRAGWQNTPPSVGVATATVAIDGRGHMGDRDHDSTDDLLQELLWTYGPCGQEEAVRTVCARELQPWVDDMWTDDAGNLIGYIGVADAESREHRHRSSTISEGRATRVMAHMDELSMLVKRVETDGTLHMTQLGGMDPGNFGLGPVALV